MSFNNKKSKRELELEKELRIANKNLGDLSAYNIMLQQYDNLLKSENENLKNEINVLKEVYLESINRN